MGADQIRQAQQALAAMGYYRGPVNGRMNGPFESAVASYQAGRGEAVTGVLTTRQLGALVRSAPGVAPNAGQGVAGQDPGGLGAGAAAFGSPEGDTGGMPAPPSLGPRTRAAGTVGADAVADPQAVVAALERGAVFEWPGISGYETDNGQVERELVRRIVAARPTVLENDATLSNWLQRFAYAPDSSWPLPNVAALYETHSRGTEFDKDRVQSELKAALSAQATKAPLTVVRVRIVTLPPYDKKAGGFLIPLGDGQGGSRDYTIIGQSPAVKGNFAEELPASALMTMPSAQAEALAKRLGPTRVMHVATRVTFSGFGDGEAPGEFFVLASAKVDGVSVHVPSRDKGQRLGQLIARLPVAGASDEALPAAATADSPIASWRSFGVPVAGDRILVAMSGTGSMEEGSPFLRPLTLKALSREPLYADDLAGVVYLAQNYLTREQRNDLFGRKLDENRLAEINRDPFVAKDVVNRFKRDYLPRLLSAVPHTPVKVRVSVPVIVNSYDFAKGAFLIGTAFNAYQGGSSNAVRINNVIPRWDGQTDLASLPQEIRVEEQAARALTARLKAIGPVQGGIARIFAAYDFELTDVAKPAPRQGPTTASLTWSSTESALKTSLLLKFEAVSFYEDKELTRAVPDFKATPQIVTPKEPERDPLATSGPAPRPLLSAWGMMGLAARAGAGDDFIDSALRASSPYTSINEFDRPAMLDKLQATVRSWTPAAGAPLNLSGRVTLGEYANGAFSIKYWSMSTVSPQNSPVPGRDFVAMQISNPEALLTLPVNATLGRQLVTSEPKREFSAIFIGRAGKAERQDTRDYAKAVQAIEIEEILLLHPRDSSRYIVRVNPRSQVAAPATSDQVALARRPERVPFDRDTLALWQQKVGGDESDAIMKQRMVLRYEIEANKGMYNLPSQPEVWGRFFPTGYPALTDADVARFMPAFRKWNAQRVAALPTKATITWLPSWDKSLFGKGASFHPMMANYGLSKDTYSYKQLTLDIPQGGPPGFKGGVIEFWHGPQNFNAQDAFVRIPDLPVPSDTSGSYEWLASIDVDLELAGSDVRPDGVPRLALDATATQVRWYSGYTGTMPRRLLGTFPVTPSEAPARTASAPSPAVPAQPDAPVQPAVPAQPAAPAVGPDQYDIIGLKLGMSFADAEAAIRANMDVGKVLKLSPNPSDPPSVFVQAAVFLSRDLGEYVILLTETERTGGRVLGIGRYVFRGIGAFNLKDLTQSFEAKYGGPPHRSGGALHWGGSPRPSQGDSNCHLILGFLGRGNWVDETGQQPDFSTLLAPGMSNTSRGPVTMPWPGLKVLQFDQFAVYKGCGPTVAAYLPELNGRTSEFTVWLIDIKAYIDAWTGPLMPSAGGGAPKIKL